MFFLMYYRWIKNILKFAPSRENEGANFSLFITEDDAKTTMWSTK